MKKKKAKTKKAPVGWKKQKGGFIYYFKGSVAKRLKIQKIDFLTDKWGQPPFNF